MHQNNIVLSGIYITIIISLSASLSMADELSDAKSLMSAGKPADAYTKLLPGITDHSNDGDYLYTAAVSAFDSQKFKEAIPLLLQSIQLSPDNFGARVDLGIAYFNMGEREKARAELDFVKAQNPPARILYVANRYLSAIREQQAALSSKLNAHIDLGAGFNDNINSATGQQQIAIPVFGNALMNLNNSSVKKSASYGMASVGINAIQPLSFNAAFFEDITLSAKNYFNGTGFNSLSPDIRGGIVLNSQSDFFRVSAFANRHALHNIVARESVGASADWYHLLDESNKIGLFAQSANYRFFDTAQTATPSMPNENFVQTLYAATWLHTVNERMNLSFATILGHEAAPNRIDGNKDTTGARFSASRLLSEVTSVSGNVGYQQGRYRATNPLFLTIRSDEQFDADVGVTYNIQKNIALRYQLSVVKNKSNIALNQSTTKDASVFIRYMF